MHAVSVVASHSLRELLGLASTVQPLLSFIPSDGVLGGGEREGGREARGRGLEREKDHVYLHLLSKMVPLKP